MEMIKVTRSEDGSVAVSGRELHEFLGVGKKFADWIKGRIKKYDFKEGEDYISLSQKREGNNANLIEYVLTLDMAKELAMVENNDKGKQARKYFIEIEKKYREQPQLSSTPMNQEKQITISANDLITMAKQLGNVVSSQAEIIKSLEIENKVLKERIHHAPVQELETYTQMQLGIDEVPKDDNLIYTITEIAAEYKMNAKNLNSLLHEIKIQYPLNGMWILYADHRDKGYTKTIKKHMYWTELGKEFIKQKLSELEDREWIG